MIRRLAIFGATGDLTARFLLPSLAAWSLVGLDVAVLLIATAVHVLTCLGAAVAPDVAVLAALRLLQGMGAAGGGVEGTVVEHEGTPAPGGPPRIER